MSYLLRTSLVILLLALTGCNSEPEVEDPETPTTVEPAVPTEQQPDELPASTGGPTETEPEPEPDKIVTEPPPQFDPPAPMQIPEVKMTETEDQTNKVRVGDTFPDAELPNLAGKPQQLKKLLGDKLTVVALVETGNLYSEEPLTFLYPHVVKPFGDKGLKVLVIHEGGTLDQVASQVDQTESRELTHLHDADKTILEQVATEHLPRVYLLDKQGKILWFDIEFSTTTRDLLDRALKAGLGIQEKPAAAEDTSN